MCIWVCVFFIFIKFQCCLELYVHIETYENIKIYIDLTRIVLIGKLDFAHSKNFTNVVITLNASSL